jgi:dephospho-CoA kinase
MSETHVVAITGSIGSGKSSLCRILKAKGIPFIDADELARQIVLPLPNGNRSDALRLLTERFGDAILAEGGTLNRAALGTLVFSDPSARKETEAILHPLIRNAYCDAITILQNVTPPPPYIAYAIPLLFETAPPLPPHVTLTVMVHASKALCIERVRIRNGMSLEEASKRYESQLQSRIKISRADIVLSNEESLSVLQSKAERLHAQLMSRILMRKSSLSAPMDVDFVE